MLEKPPLADEKIIACLKQTYGLAVARLDFLPLGYDANAGVYRVEADGLPYFLKVKGSPVEPLSVRLPRTLREQGLVEVVAPLPTINGALWGTVDSFTLILYPFVEGRSGWDVGLSDGQWVALGGFLKRLHSIQLPPDLLGQIPRETFVPSRPSTDFIKRAHRAIPTASYGTPIERELAAFWNHRHAEIGAIIDRTERLSRMLQEQPFAPVLCHADIHTANVLVAPDGALRVVDWDQPVLAPRERDLQFVTVGDYIREARVEALFFEGYGPTQVDPRLMAYYRYQRVMEDLAEFAQQVFAADAGEATRRDSAEWFMRQFEPGGAVEAAKRLDYVLDG